MGLGRSRGASWQLRGVAAFLLHCRHPPWYQLGASADPRASPNNGPCLILPWAFPAVGTPFAVQLRVLDVSLLQLCRSLLGTPDLHPVGCWHWYARGHARHAAGVGVSTRALVELSPGVRPAAFRVGRCWAAVCPTLLPLGASLSPTGGIRPFEAQHTLLRAAGPGVAGWPWCCQGGWLRRRVGSVGHSLCDKVLAANFNVLSV